MPAFLDQFETCIYIRMLFQTRYDLFFDGLTADFGARRRVISRRVIGYIPGRISGYAVPLLRIRRTARQPIYFCLRVAASRFLDEHGNRCFVSEVPRPARAEN